MYVMPVILNAVVNHIIQHHGNKTSELDGNQAPTYPDLPITNPVTTCMKGSFTAKEHPFCSFFDKEYSTLG